jgi:muconate cycloisomerase
VPDLVITAIETTIVDVPLVRPHRFASLTMREQSLVVVRVRTRDGVDGTGEAVVPGGPWWGGDSVESIRATIDRYLAPHLVGEPAGDVERLTATMDRFVKGNAFAKAAVEMALWDALGRALDVPVHVLFGGLRRTSLPVTWALGADPADVVVEEARGKLAAGEHTTFKLKMGRAEPAEDVARVAAVAEALAGEAGVRVDLNGSWDESTARAWLPRLADAGVELVEQPVPGWNVDAMARLAERLDVPLMADESVQSTHDALAICQRRAADVLAVKVAKSGGLGNTRRIAAIADAAGMPCYGGTTLESSIGTAASLHAFCSTGAVSAGSELFGPLLLADDLVEEPVAYRGGEVRVPTGPGLGVTLDEDKVAKYARADGA